VPFGLRLVGAVLAVMQWHAQVKRARMLMNARRQATVCAGFAFAGGQAAVSVAGALGRVKAGVEATLTGPSGAALSGSESDSRTGLSDLYPTATLKWNRGAHNYMVYAAAGVPVGAYDPTRLANIGINHWALDAGSGYTYFDERSGNELSAVIG